MDRFKQLSKRLSAKVLLPADKNYQQQRKIWNGLVDNFPKLIVQPQSVADIIEAVKFAGDNALQISVRAGGHGVAGHAILNDGMVIDLSRMKGCYIDLKTQRAVAEAGLLGSELDRETQQFGLATPLGTVSHTGISGLTLGGGYGWLSRKYGLACDNLVSINLVTAAGNYLNVDAQQHPELFWALKGGGSNFGVITSFQYALHKVGPEVFSGSFLYPLSQAKTVLNLYRELTEQCDNDLTVYLFFLPIKQELFCSLTFLYHGSVGDGNKIAARLRKSLKPIKAKVGLMPYLALQKHLDKFAPHGLNYYWRANYMAAKSISDSAIQTILEQLKLIPSKKSLISLEHTGGAVNTMAKESTAFFHRNANYNLLICSAWQEPQEQQINIDYTNKFWTEMRPYFLENSYQNYGGADPKIIYGTNFAKLSQLKKVYDPDYRFVGNHLFAQIYKE